LGDKRERYWGIKEKDIGG